MFAVKTMWCMALAAGACGGRPTVADSPQPAPAPSPRHESEGRPRARVQLWRSEAPMLERGAFFITPFVDGIHNRLGGRFGTFAGGTATAVLETLDGDSGLLFRFSQSSGGEAGFWLHLFDDRVEASDRTYLHTGAAKSLAFEIRGSHGAEVVILSIADRKRLESASWPVVGAVNDYLPERKITDSWQTARIPLTAIPDGVETEALASIVFTIDAGTEGRIQIRNLGLFDGSASDRR